jgi:hypothetical protein
VRNGSHALQLSAGSGSTSFAYARRALSAPYGEVTASTDFRVTTEGASGGNVSALRLFDGAGSRVAGLYRVNVTGEVWLKIGSSTFQKISASLPLNTWTRLTLHLKVGPAGAGVVDVYKDGIKAFSTTTATLGINPIATVELGNDTTAQTFASVADNVAITSGTP